MDNTHSASIQKIQEPFASFGHFKKRWQKQIDDAAREWAHTRRAYLDPSKQLASSNEPESQIVSADRILTLVGSSQCPEAGLIVETHGTKESRRSWDEILEEVEVTYGLNKRQVWCFRICANRFHALLVEKQQNVDQEGDVARSTTHSQPLRFLLTGPGGTGKTYTISAFQNLMSKFDSAHLIRFLAPTREYSSQPSKWADYT